MGPQLVLVIALAIGFVGCSGKPKAQHPGSESSSGFQYGALGAHKTMGDARKQRREKKRADDSQTDSEN